MRLTALLTVGLVAGTVIVASSLVGLTSQISVITKLRRRAPPAGPQSKPTR